MINESQVYWPLSLVTAKGRLDKSTFGDRLELALGTKALRLLAHQIDEFWPHDAVGEAGVVFYVRGNG